MRINITISDDVECRHGYLRTVPRLGAITEQVIRPVPTPHLQGQHKGPLLMAFQMTDSQKVTITLSFQDRRGNPAPTPPGSNTTWLVDNPSVASLTPSADGLSCDVAAIGPLGDFRLSSRTADASDNPLSAGVLDGTIVSGAPSVSVLKPGTPTEQP